jgi:hypothetical protein
MIFALSLPFFFATGVRFPEYRYCATVHPIATLVPEIPPFLGGAGFGEQNTTLWKSRPKFERLVFRFIRSKMLLVPHMCLNHMELLRSF